ncbi:hypothetical protein YC2023_066354 [Brassica napus]
MVECRFPLSLKIVSQREAGLSGPDYWYYVCRQYVRNPPILGLCRVTRRTVGCRAVTRMTVGRGWLKVPSSGLCGFGIESKVVDIKAMRFPLLEARSWQEAMSNLVTVALGRAQSWIILCRGRGVKFVTLTGLSLARHVALSDHGVGLDGQSCSCLIVGWPVGLSSPTLGVGRPSVMFLFDCWPVGRPMLRTEVRRIFQNAKGGSVRVKISLSRPCQFLHGEAKVLSKSRSVQSSPVKTFISGFGQVLSDQPAASLLEHCELVLFEFHLELRIPLSLKIVSQHEAVLSGPYRPDYWYYVVPTVLTLSHKVVDIKAMRFPLLEARLSQDAKSNLVTVALDTVLVSTINDADLGSADVAFRTPLAPYEKTKFLGSGGSMVARLKLKGIGGREPPGVEPAA